MDDGCNIGSVDQPKPGELDVKDENVKFTTTEYFTTLSHGIFDHAHKFVPSPFTLYAYLLCYAKKDEPGAGLYSFHMREIIEMFSNPRGSAENKDQIHKSTVCSFLSLLVEADLIEIRNKPTGKHDSVWQIKICKFKTMGSFLCLRNRYQAGVAEPLAGRNGRATVPTPATRKQLQLFEAESERRRGVKNDVPSCTRNARDNSSLLYNNVESLKEHLRKMGKEYLVDLLEELRSSKRSSEDIIPPDMACRWTQEAMVEINAGRDADALKQIRNELMRRYWNGLRMNGVERCIFKNCLSIGTRRQMMITVRFSSKLFKENWAHALVEIKNSPYCRGEDSKWVASFDWFIKSEKPVVNAMDGMYYDRNEVKPNGTRTTGKGGIVRQVSGQNYLEGTSLSSVQDHDLEEWIRTNPEAAEEARKSGLLEMRLGDRADPTDLESA